MEQKMNSPFRLLMNKDVYAILDGDTQFEEYEFSDDCTKSAISMPYLSGPDLCALCSMFGLPMTYSWGGVKHFRTLRPSCGAGRCRPHRRMDTVRPARVGCANPRCERRLSCSAR